MGWRDRTVTNAGSVLFRGRMPPRLQEFAPALTAAGVVAEPVPADGNHWAADLRHPQWGAARAVCFRDAPTPSAALVDFAPNLDAAERAAAKSAGSSVSVSLEGGRGDVLRDRKSLLRFLRALMADDGLVAVDHTAQRFWPRAALDDELAHDADLDVEALFATHAVSEDAPEGGDSSDDDDADRPTKWLHTHGLAEVGFFDFDVLAPHVSVVAQGGVDALRVMAFDILEEAARPGADRHPLAGGPGGAVRLVDVGTFNRRAAPRDVALRLGADAAHNADRVVLCDPPGGLLGRWFGRPRPCGWLQREVGDGDLLLLFSDAATELMAERARATWPRLRAFAAELAEFGFPTIAKIGYETDAGAAGAAGARREHLWFEVHEARDASADATLQSEPFNIAGMRAGDRGEHPLERLTDWSIVTPAGMITPRSTAPLRRIREHKDKLREMMRAART